MFRICLSRPLGYSIFSLMALIGDPLYIYIYIDIFQRVSGANPAAQSQCSTAAPSFELVFLAYGRFLLLGFGVL